MENYEIVKAAKVTFKEWLKRDFRLLVREELTTDENAVLLAFGNMVWDAALKQGAQKTPTNTSKDKIIADIKEFLINKAVSKKAFGLETWITDRFGEYDYSLAH